MPKIIPPVPQGIDWGEDVVYQFLEDIRQEINQPVFFSQSTDPGAAGVPNGSWSIWLNTTTGVLKLWANQNGALKSVTLT